MITFDNVSKEYPSSNGYKIRALENINLRVGPKEFVCLAGPSGAGKSTLFKLIIVEEKPSSGKVIIDNENSSLLRGNQIPLFRRKIGMIFQDFRLLENKTVYENIAFAMEVANYSNKEIAEDIPQILEIVGLSDKKDQFPRQISGGEQQRVAIARSLIHRPKIILADEPTGNLDLLNSWDVVRLLLKINELGTTILLATHDQNIIKNLNKRVITLDKGRIIRDENNQNNK